MSCDLHEIFIFIADAARMLWCSGDGLAAYLELQQVASRQICVDVVSGVAVEVGSLWSNDL
jgi:hypothetical protein